MLLVFTLNLLAAGYMAYYYDQLVNQNLHPFVAVGLSIFLYVATLGLSLYLSAQVLPAFPENTEENVINLAIFTVMFLIQSIPAAIWFFLQKNRTVA